ncbi:lasso peptide biosynthesis B2 protein [Candidatus Sumerlaeota bacterium]|nr:lasso peptide biosynthesis B2 protein [Candidatus Sumerlaeota bacterium]
MNRILKFLNLPPAERRLLIQALFCLVVARVRLWTLPLRRLLEREPRTDGAPVGTGRCDPLPAERTGWAIRAVSRYLPGTRNCLAQALAARAMLARQGRRAQLRIGAAKNEKGRFKAHAWVECEGKIVIGHAGVSQYTPFPQLENPDR